MTPENIRAAREALDELQKQLTRHGLGSFDMDRIETIRRALTAERVEKWLPKEQFEKPGAEVIGWLCSEKGFGDVTARLVYIDSDLWPSSKGWHWAESEEPVTRPDLIRGVKPWPAPPALDKGE